MTTAVYNTTPSNASSVLFREWGGGISAALSAIGLVKTSDTGQINWTTVLAPIGGSQSMGYEIYRFNDSLQATYPIFVKVEYGSGSTTAYTGIWWTIGAATDGAGTLSQLLSVRAQQTSAAASTTAAKSYASMLANGSGFALALWPSLGSNYSRFVIVERSCDSSGVPNGNGTFIAMKTTSLFIHATYTTDFTTKTVNANASLLVTIPSPQMATSSYVPTYPILAAYPGYEWQLRSGVVGHITDMGGSEVVSTVPGPGYGPYLNTGVIATEAYTANSNTALAIAWS